VAPTFLDNRLTDGGEDVSLTQRPSFAQRKIPGTHSCYRLSRPQGHSAAGRIRTTENPNDLNGNRTRDIPACSIVPQPTTPPVSHNYRNLIKIVTAVFEKTVVLCFGVHPKGPYSPVTGPG
jgi:hypothetical protein